MFAGQTEGASLVSVSVRGVLRAITVAAVVGAAACKPSEQAVVPTAPPSPPVATSAVQLTRADLEALLAVRTRALGRLEESLEDVLRTGGDVGTKVKELSAAEREAAAALGVDWRRYVWVRDEVARLVTLQRQEEDLALLQAELERARQELDQQLTVARDPASREFLQAQRLTLERQHAKLIGSARSSPARVEALALLEEYRAELAVQQSRQEKLQRRLREVLRSSRAEQLSTSP